MSTFKFKPLWALLLMLGLILAPAAGFADIITLTNGRKVVGIVDQTSSDDSQVTIQTNLGTLSIPRVKIETIDAVQNLGRMEAQGDLAMSEDDLDRALTLYRKAYSNEPDNDRLKKKIDDIEQKIRDRDHAAYGKELKEIQDAIANGAYMKAIEDATNLARRAHEDTAKERCQKLIYEAHLKLAQDYRDRVDYSKAQAHYELASQAWAKGALAPLELADMLQVSPANKRTAISLYEQGLRLAEVSDSTMSDLDMLKYRFQLGRLYFDEKQFIRAADTFLYIANNDSAYNFPDAVDMTVEAYSRLQGQSEDNALANSEIVQNLETITKIKPSETRAYFLLGRIYFDQGDWAKARDHLSKVIELTPEDGSQQRKHESLEYLGIAYRNLGDTEMASEAFGALIQDRAASYEAICELAEINLQQNQYDRSLDLFEMAQQLNGDKYRAYLGLGRTLQRLGQYKAARENYRKVVELDPANATAQLAIGQSFFDEESFPEAAEEGKVTVDLLKELAQVDGGTMTAEQKQLMADAYVLTGRAFIRSKKNHTARESFQEALKYVADYAPAYDGIGTTFQNDLQHREAEEYFLKAITASPDTPDYYLSLGINLHQHRKTPKKALPFYLKYLELGGKEPKVREWIRECGGTPPPLAAASAPSSEG